MRTVRLTQVAWHDDGQGYVRSCNSRAHAEKWRLRFGLRRKYRRTGVNPNQILSTITTKRPPYTSHLPLCLTGVCADLRLLNV